MSAKQTSAPITIAVPIKIDFPVILKEIFDGAEDSASRNSINFLLSPRPKYF